MGAALRYQRQGLEDHRERRDARAQLQFG
jgi:hypothetical protein